MMTWWTIEEAKRRLAEVLRRALAREPQIATLGSRDEVVVVPKDDNERLIAPVNIVEFLRNSPMAAAVAAGELPEAAFERRRDLARDSMVPLD